MTPLLLALVSCTAGELSGTIRPEDRPAVVVVDDDDGLGACDIPSIGPTPLRRLTADEYTATALAVFDVDVDLQDHFPAEPLVDGFDNAAASVNISQLRAERIYAAAQTVAAAAVTRLDTLLPCDPGMIDEACVDAFIRGVGSNVYRRPLDDDEFGVLRRVYDTPEALVNAERVELAIQAMLIAPQFVFVIERGAAGPPERVPLTTNEIATRLAFMIWREGPDEALLTRAPQLATADGIAAVATDMLADPRGRRGAHAFFDHWLDLHRVDELDKDATDFPQFDAAMRTAIGSEARRFIDEIVLTAERPLQALLTSQMGHVSEPLATVYGVGASDTAVDLGPNRRGVLTRAAFLGTQAHGRVASPVLRGLFIRKRLLCQDLPAPPNDVVVTVPEPRPDSTNRERFSRHAEDPACSGCHRLMDPIGFGFEAYDAIGAFRTTEQGRPIDATGELIGTDDVDGTYDGASELIDRLASSEQVCNCAVEHMFRYAFGRRSTRADACTMASLQARFREGDGDFLELMVAIAASDAFRHRRGDAAPSAVGPRLVGRFAGRDLPWGATVELPNAEVAERVAVTLQIDNRGDTEFVFGTPPIVMGGSDAFAVTVPTAAIPAGGSAQLELTFVAAARGTHEGSIAVIDASAATALAFDVSGKADTATTGVSMFVAVGDAGRRTVSPDGVTWMHDSWEPGNEGDNDRLFRGVAYGGGLYVAIGGSQIARVSVTRDGSSWTEAALEGGFLEGIAYGAGFWVAAGANGRTIRSRDAATWIDPQIDYGPHFRSMKFGNGRFVAVGDRGRRRTTLDGLTWTDNVEGGAGFQDLAFGDGRFVAVGYEGRRVVSEDGATWMFDVTGGDQLHAVAYGNGRFVAIGGARVAVSSNGGETWVEQPGPPLNRISFGNASFVATGWQDTRWTSPDGLVWQEVAGGVTDPGYGAITFGDGH